MAISREEAILELGLNAKKVEAGLTSVSGYFKKWSEKVKSDQEKYTDWWSNELKKREQMEVDASVRAATRANRARRLLREREERRLNAPMQGPDLDGSMRQAASTPEGLSPLMRNLVAGNLMRMVGAFSIVSLLKELLAEVLPTAQEFWDSVYGVDSKAGERLDAARANLRRLGQTVKDAVQAERDAAAAWVFSNMSPAEQKSALEEQLAETQRAKNEAFLNARGFRERATDHRRFGEQYRTQNPVRFAEIMEEANAIGQKAAEEDKKRAEAGVKEFEIKTRIKQVEEGIARTKAEQNRQANALLANDKARLFASQESSRRMMEGFMPSLGELANAGYSTGGRATSGLGTRRRWIRSPFGAMADNILGLGDQAKDQFIWGNVGGAKASINERNRLYDQLAELGIVPQRAEKSAQAQLDMAESIKAIREGKAVIRVAPELEE